MLLEKKVDPMLVVDAAFALLEMVHPITASVL
jgi:hypothetical protein